VTATQSAPRHSPRLFALFSRYLRRYFRRHFDAVRLMRPGFPELGDGPVVFYANHPSWWDPILFMLLAQSGYPQRRHFGPMDAAALGRYRLFERLGVFGVEQGTTAGARQFLRGARAALAEPGGTLWVTPEGQFRDARDRARDLQPGLAALLDPGSGYRAVPLALEYVFWNERLPEVLVRFGEPVSAAKLPVDRAARSRLLAERLEATQRSLAEPSRRRDDAAFVTVLGGSAGVGGVYDLWRRLRAGLRGESFEAAHELRREQDRGSRPNPAGAP